MRTSRFTGSMLQRRTKLRYGGGGFSSTSWGSPYLVKTFSVSLTHSLSVSLSLHVSHRPLSVAHHDLTALHTRFRLSEPSSICCSTATKKSDVSRYWSCRVATSPGAGPASSEASSTLPSAVMPVRATRRLEKLGSIGNAFAAGRSTV